MLRNSNEVLINERQNLEKHRVDKNRLLFASAINVVTFFCAIFSMGYYEWVEVEFAVQARGRDGISQSSPRRWWRYGRTCSTGTTGSATWPTTSCRSCSVPRRTPSASPSSTSSASSASSASPSSSSPSSSAATTSSASASSCWGKSPQRAASSWRAPQCRTSKTTSAASS